MARRRRPPRQFQYLDAALIESYLSDLVGGLPEGGSSTGRYTDSSQKDRGLRYRGTGFGSTKGTEESSEDQETFRITPEAIFRRLHDELERETDEGKILVHLDSLNRNSWGELVDGDIVQITGTIKLPEILQALEGAKGVERLLPVLDQLGQLTGEDTGFGEEDRALLSGMGSMREMIQAQDASVVVVEVAKSPRYRFVAKLKKDDLRVPLGDLTGEAKIVGAVNRKINRGDPPIGLEQLVPEFGALRNLPGYQEPPQNRAARRSKGKKNQEEDPLSIGYPAATLTPIAIFR